MLSFFRSLRTNYFDHRHLLLVDLNSSGMSFYLAKDVSDLASIDFAHLTLLKKVFDLKLCKNNLLASQDYFRKVFNDNLRSFDLESFSLVFLLSPDFSELEKEAIKEASPFLSKVTFIDRHFFYNFYLIQKRNFSKTKFLINLFTDCAELSLFDQDKILAHKQVFLRNLAFESKNFLDKNKEKFAYENPDCFYLFTNNIKGKAQVSGLAKYLKLEVIEVDKLC